MLGSNNVLYAQYNLRKKKCPNDIEFKCGKVSQEKLHNKKA
jgi:hypothetical protein